MLSLDDIKYKLFVKAKQIFFELILKSIPDLLSKIDSA